MGRFHPSLPDYDEDLSKTTVPPEGSNGTLGYNLLEKFAIVGVLETTCIGGVAVLARSSYFTRRKLSPAQTNIAIVGALGLAPLFIIVQKMYYDTLLEARGMRPQAGSGGLGCLNFSVLSPTRLTWDDNMTPANYNASARWDT